MVDEVVIAYHEAGHVLLAERFGARVLSVTIEPADDDGPRRHGETTVAWTTIRGNANEVAMKQAAVALGGPAAEMIYCDQQYEVEVIQEWWADWLVASKSIRSVKPGLPDEAVLVVIERLVRDQIAWLSQDAVWDRLARVADELEAHETLDAERLQELREYGFLS